MLRFCRITTIYEGDAALCETHCNLVPEGCQVLHVSHGWIEASGEGDVDGEPDSGPAAHLQTEARV